MKKNYIYNGYFGFYLRYSSYKKDNHEDRYGMKLGKLDLD